MAMNASAILRRIERLEQARGDGRPVLSFGHFGEDPALVFASEGGGDEKRRRFFITWAAPDPRPELCTATSIQEALPTALERIAEGKRSSMPGQRLLAQEWEDLWRGLAARFELEFEA